VNLLKIPISKRREHVISLARTRNKFLFTSALLLIASAAHPQDQNNSYELDDVSREVSAKGKLACPQVPLIRYKGARVRYSQPARVHPAFAKRLERFEQVVAETAVAVFGREPTHIVQKGSYSCRRVRSIPTLISEHSLGNAIDVYVFEFGPLKKGETLPDGLPKRFKRAFNVVLLKHWDATSEIGAYYSTFLKQLAENLVDRTDIFKVLLGPAYPGHKNHFHFDCASYTLVSI
jgi:hypothetical protein